MRGTLFLSAVVAAGLSAGAFAQDARYRAVHSSPDTGAVDVLVDGGEVLGDVEFFAASPYLSAPAGSYNVQITAANMPSTVAIDANVNLAADTDYTIVAFDRFASIQPLVLVDDNTIDPTQARVRFVHTGVDAPAVDVVVAGGGPTLFNNVSFGQSGGYQSVLAGTYDLEVRVSADDSLALSLPGVSLEAGTVYTVFATGILGGDPALGADIVVDAIPSPGAAAPLAALGLMAVRRRRRA